MIISTETQTFMQGASWNYGASSQRDFAGGVANAVHSGGVGMFGSYGHVDTGNPSSKVYYTLLSFDLDLAA